MWDAFSTEAMYRTEQLRRSRGVEPDHHRSPVRRQRAHRWTRRSQVQDRGVDRR